MRGMFVAALVAMIALVATVPSAFAADKAVEIRPRDGTYVKVRQVHRYLRCPDRYSCYPLYGAYGPYGGEAYWAAYSGFVPEQYR